MENTTPKGLPRLAMRLGWAGVLPMAVALLAVLSGDPRFQFAAFAIGHAYAALIFSFLGGLWWGLAARADNPPNWLWHASVVPTLLALATFVPWVLGWPWPGYSLLVLGLAIATSLAVDLRAVAAGCVPEGWLGLRVPLSLGLGGATFLLGLAAV
jgi:hypothetical protein